MSETNKNKISSKKLPETYSLNGALRLRARVSPDYINNLTRQAYMLFDSEEAEEAVAKMFTGQVKEGEFKIPDEFARNSKALIQKVHLNTGVLLEFLEGKVEFNTKGKVQLVNDILGEITIKDGIVVKIEEARFPEPV